MEDKKLQFGNLAKLVPLTIISVAVGVALVIAVARGLAYDGLLDAAKVLATGAGAALVGSLTAAVGKSQTRIDLEASRSESQPVKDVQAEPVRSGSVAVTEVESSGKRFAEPEISDTPSSLL